LQLPDADKEMVFECRFCDRNFKEFRFYEEHLKPCMRISFMKEKFDYVMQFIIMNGVVGKAIHKLHYFRKEAKHLFTIPN
jgi:hypothetical protein